MNPIKFDQANKVYTKPKDWKDEDCSDLYVFEGSAPLPSGGETPVSISCWKLTPEELEKIKETGIIYLQICGGQPPVSLYIESPFQ